MSIFGVAAEERRDLSKAEIKALRQRSLRLLGTSVRPLRRRIAATMGMVIVSTLAQVAGPTLLAIGIDQGLGALVSRGDWKPSLWIALGYVTLSALGATMLMLYRRSSTTVSQTVMFDLRAKMFEHTQKLGVAFHERYTSGRVIARQTSDLDTVRIRRAPCPFSLRLSRCISSPDGLPDNRVSHFVNRGFGRPG